MDMVRIAKSLEMLDLRTIIYFVGIEMLGVWSVFVRILGKHVPRGVEV